MRDGYATAPEVAEVLGVAVNTVRNRMRRGQIPYREFREGGKVVRRIPIGWLITTQGLPPSVVQAAAQFLQEEISGRLKKFFESEGGEELMRRLTAREGELREEIGYWKGKHEEAERRIGFLVRKIDELQEGASQRKS